MVGISCLCESVHLSAVPRVLYCVAVLQLYGGTKNLLGVLKDVILGSDVRKGCFFRSGGIRKGIII